LLPSSAPSLHEAGFAWGFRPCAELAGDLLNVVQLDDRRVGLYVLDVVGHGVAAALLSVAVTRVLTPRPDGHSLLSRSDPNAAGLQLTAPSKVAEELNRLFPMTAPTEQFFTLLYGILDLDAMQFRYVSAGHPGPVRISAGGNVALDSKTAGLPIGIGELPYVEQVMQLERADRVYLYSDGLTEAMNEESQQFEATNLLGTISQSRSLPLKDSVSAVMDAAERWCGKRAPHDDITLVAFEVGGGR
jgi:sigma-B regulation protein RsbU (phosphoserine phosphatase)